MAYVWETQGSRWQERDGRFLRDGTPAARAPDVVRLLGGRAPACHCAAAFPEDFAFCPECGRALQRVARAEVLVPELPRHVPSGLPVTMRAMAPRGRPASKLPAPPNAFCVFHSGRFGYAEERLLALAPARQALQYWDPAAQLWQILSPQQGAAPLGFGGAHGWLAGDKDAGVIPSAGGLLRLWVDLLDDSYRTETLCAAPLASAPARLRGRLACLIHSDAGLALWTETDTLHLGALPAQGWSVPHAYDDALCWLHPAGQLWWKPGAPAAWYPWPAGFTPRLAFGGPAQSRDGRLWVQGHADGSYQFCELGTPDPERQLLDGARFGFAQFLFRRGQAVLGDPWANAQVVDPQDEHSVLLPLLRVFDSDSSKPQGLVLRVLNPSLKAEDMVAGELALQARIEWFGQEHHVLESLPALKAPMALRPFVYDDALWLHHPQWHQILGWPLKEGI